MMNFLSKSINVHDVYHFLKNLPAHELRQIYYERSLLLTNKLSTFLNKTCIYTMTQSTLMFRDTESSLISKYKTESE